MFKKIMRLGCVLASHAVVLCLPAMAGSTQQVAEDTAPPVIEGWSEFIHALDVLPGAMLAKLPEEMRNDPAIRQEVGRLILATLASSTIDVLSWNGDHPVFVPATNLFLNVTQPNADTIYRTARVTPGGIYRLKGRIGTTRIANLGQVGQVIPDLDKLKRQATPQREYLNINGLKVDKNGEFDLIISPRRPENVTGDWWKLEPGTNRILLRLVSSDWANERDPTISIERLDVPAGKSRVMADEMEKRLRMLPTITTTMASLFIDHFPKLQQEGVVNSLKLLDLSKIGGLTGQVYYEGAFDLEENEALVLETKAPEQCEYYSLLLTNEIYETIDWYNNQSSLNDAQVALNSDGMLRVVISARDPGLTNWLDTAGHSKGIFMARWTGCANPPQPTVTKVTLDQVRGIFPPDTPQITAQQRDKQIRERRSAYQQRPLW